MDDLQRATFASLIVLEVHSKDVIDLVQENNVASVEDFNWMS